jgi:hypothetical protein
MYLLLVDPAAAELTTHPHCRVGTPPPPEVEDVPQESFPVAWPGERLPAAS